VGGAAGDGHALPVPLNAVERIIVNHEGVIYEKDLGPTTAKTAQWMETFNPDRTWTLVPEDESEKTKSPDRSPEISRKKASPDDEVFGYWNGALIPTIGSKKRDRLFQTVSFIYVPS
jgi:hypothetical protein